LGVEGIVTALHGVVGDKTISAWNERQSVFSNLVVRRVDIPNDLALLSSAELQNAPDDGLESGRNETILQGENLTAWGHPVGIRVKKKPVKVGDPPEEELTTHVATPGFRRICSGFSATPAAIGVPMSTKR